MTKLGPETVPTLSVVARKVATWMEKQANASDARAEQWKHRFPAFVDANRIDAKNYRAMAAELRASLEAEGR